MPLPASGGATIELDVPPGAWRVCWRGITVSETVDVVEGGHHALDLPDFAGASLAGRGPSGWRIDVSYLAGESRHEVASAAVDEEGTFAFAGLPPGPYLVLATSPGGTFCSRSLTLSPGQHADVGDLGGTRFHTVTFRIRDAGGRPHARTSVHVRGFPNQTSAQWHAVTDEAGELRLELPDGFGVGLVVPGGYAMIASDALRRGSLTLVTPVVDDAWTLDTGADEPVRSVSLFFEDGPVVWLLDLPRRAPGHFSIPRVRDGSLLAVFTSSGREFWSTRADPHRAQAVQAHRPALLDPQRLRLAGPAASATGATVRFVRLAGLDVAWLRMHQPLTKAGASGPQLRLPPGSVIHLVSTSEAEPVPIEVGAE